MTHRRIFPAVAVLAAVLGVAGCSGGASTAAGSTPAGATSSGPGSSAPASTPASSTPPASTAPAAAAGTATDFCSAYQEYRESLNADTPQLQGAGFRTAAVDLRRFAPAEIKDAAGLFADVMDEVGQAIAAGQKNPETLGAGQSEARRQALADSITWITAHCHS